MMMIMNMQINRATDELNYTLLFSELLFSEIGMTDIPHSGSVCICLAQRNEHENLVW